jgi:hypothetical protein
MQLWRWRAATWRKDSEKWKGLEMSAEHFGRRDTTFALEQPS